MLVLILAFVAAAAVERSSILHSGTFPRPTGRALPRTGSGINGGQEWTIRAMSPFYRKTNVVLRLRGGAGQVVDSRIVGWRELTRQTLVSDGGRWGEGGMCSEEAIALKEGSDWRHDAPAQCG